MNRNFLVLIALLLASSTPAFALRCFFDHRQFYAPGQGTYAEFIVSFEAATLVLQPADSGFFQSFAQIQFVLSQGDKVVLARKVDVLGPLVKANAPADFMALERIQLAPGQYDLELTITDQYDKNAEASVLTETVFITPPMSGQFYSDIEFVSAYGKTESENMFSKSGVDVIPLVSNYFPSNFQVLMFYAELYGTDVTPGNGNALVTSCFIEDAKGREVPETRRMKREKGAPVLVMLQTLDISALPTGDYAVVLESRDRENNVITSRKRPFARVNVQAHYTEKLNEVTDDVLKTSFVAAYTNRDSLMLILDTHQPIADNSELATIQNVLPGADLRMLQSFFYTFWNNRNPEDANAAWLNYAKMVNEVQESFGTRLKKGWQTDRGRVYLQYGPPNTRVVRYNETQFWPFEIWHYYEGNKNLRNGKFLFYNTTLDSDFELLHSDVPGETKNFDWKNMCMTRGMGTASSVNRMGSNQTQDPFSRNLVEDLWFNPH
jgi:GWxTD domain-containing protein